MVQIGITFSTIKEIIIAKDDSICNFPCVNLCDDYVPLCVYLVSFSRVTAANFPFHYQPCSWLTSIYTNVSIPMVNIYRSTSLILTTFSMFDLPNNVLKRMPNAVSNYQNILVIFFADLNTSMHMNNCVDWTKYVSLPVRCFASFIFVEEKVFKNVWEMASILSRPQCVNQQYGIRQNSMTKGNQALWRKGNNVTNHIWI